MHSLEHPKVDYFLPNQHDVFCCGIDTGSAFGGRLSAAIIGEDNKVTFLSVAAKKKYAERIIDKES